MASEPQLVQLCKQAHADSSVRALGCSGCVKYMAGAVGVDLPDDDANALIDYMAANWTVVTKDQAQAYADQGRFVVAGKKDTPHGHIVVVLPGGPVESGGYVSDRGRSRGQTLPSKGKYPRACSMSSSTHPWPGAISQGEYSTFDPWYSDHGVKYWLAPLAPAAAAGQ